MPDGTLHDPLTGLASAACLADRLRNAQALAGRAQGLAGVVWIELDQLEVLTEVHGTQLAAQAITRAADRLAAAARDSDTLAHVGGGTFALLCTVLRSTEDLVTASRRLRESVQGRAHLGEATVELTCSTRWVVLRPDEDASRLLPELLPEDHELETHLAAAGGRRHGAP